jgi:hypothetical protein
MTVDYTQPQQYTPPPAPGQPAQQKSSGCLKVFLIGCGVLLFLFVAFCAVLVFIVFAAIKKSDAYEQALNRVRNDQRVQAALGEPIEPGFWVSGSVSADVQKGGTADFTFPVSGPKTKAKVHAIAATRGQTWEFTTLDVTPANGPPINVLTP